MLFTTSINIMTEIEIENQNEGGEGGRSHKQPHAVADLRELPPRQPKELNLSRAKTVNASCASASLSSHPGSVRTRFQTHPVDMTINV